VPAAERKVNSVWYVLFDPPCAYGNPGRLKPGDSAIIDVKEARYSGYADPHPELAGGGLYRLLFAGGYYKDEFTIVFSAPNSVVSSPFFVRDSSSIH
jgi:hypothetical protein